MVSAYDISHPKHNVSRGNPQGQPNAIKPEVTITTSTYTGSDPRQQAIAKIKAGQVSGVKIIGSTMVNTQTGNLVGVQKGTGIIYDKQTRQIINPQTQAPSQASQTQEGLKTIDISLPYQTRGTSYYNQQTSKFYTPTTQITYDPKDISPSPFYNYGVKPFLDYPRYIYSASKLAPYTFKKDYTPEELEKVKPLLAQAEKYEEGAMRLGGYATTGAVLLTGGTYGVLAGTLLGTALETPKTVIKIKDKLSSVSELREVTGKDYAKAIIPAVGSSIAFGIIGSKVPFGAKAGKAFQSLFYSDIIQTGVSASIYYKEKQPEQAKLELVTAGAGLGAFFATTGTMKLFSKGNIPANDIVTEGKGGGSGGGKYVPPKNVKAQELKDYGLLGKKDIRTDQELIDAIRSDTSLARPLRIKESVQAEQAKIQELKDYGLLGKKEKSTSDILKEMAIEEDIRIQKAGARELTEIYNLEKYGTRGGKPKVTDKEVLEALTKIAKEGSWKEADILTLDIKRKASKEVGQIMKRKLEDAPLSEIDKQFVAGQVEARVRNAPRDEIYNLALENFKVGQKLKSIKPSTEILVSVDKAPTNQKRIFSKAQAEELFKEQRIQLTTKGEPLEFEVIAKPNKRIYSDKEVKEIWQQEKLNQLGRTKDIIVEVSKPEPSVKKMKPEQQAKYLAKKGELVFEDMTAKRLKEIESWANPSAKNLAKTIKQTSAGTIELDLGKANKLDWVYVRKQGLSPQGVQAKVFHELTHFKTKDILKDLERFERRPYSERPSERVAKRFEEQYLDSLNKKEAVIKDVRDVMKQKKVIETKDIFKEEELSGKTIEGKGGQQLIQETKQELKQEPPKQDMATLDIEKSPTRTFQATEFAFEEKPKSRLYPFFSSEQDELQSSNLDFGFIQQTKQETKSDFVQDTRTRTKTEVVQDMMQDFIQDTRTRTRTATRPRQRLKEEEIPREIIKYGWGNKEQKKNKKKGKRYQTSVKIKGKFLPVGLSESAYGADIAGKKSVFRDLSASYSIKDLSTGKLVKPLSSPYFRPSKRSPYINVQKEFSIGKRTGRISSQTEKAQIKRSRRGMIA